MHENKQQGFVCYDDPTGKDKLYGPHCAGRAMFALQGFDFGETLKLYINPALSKQERLKHLTKNNEL